MFDDHISTADSSIQLDHTSTVGLTLAIDRLRAAHFARNVTLCARLDALQKQGAQVLLTPVSRLDYGAQPAAWLRYPDKGIIGLKGGATNTDLMGSQSWNNAYVVVGSPTFWGSEEGIGIKRRVMDAYHRQGLLRSLIKRMKTAAADARTETAKELHATRMSTVQQGSAIQLNTKNQPQITLPNGKVIVNPAVAKNAVHPYQGDINLYQNWTSDMAIKYAQLQKAIVAAGLPKLDTVYAAFRNGYFNVVADNSQGGNVTPTVSWYRYQTAGQNGKNIVQFENGGWNLSWVLGGGSPEVNGKRIQAAMTQDAPAP